MVQNRMAHYFLSIRCSETTFSNYSVYDIKKTYIFFEKG